MISDDVVKDVPKLNRRQISGVIRVMWHSVNHDTGIVDVRK